MAYTKHFYGEMADSNLRSARAVVPIVVDLVRPKSVVDIGCGTGLWLKAFSESGIDQIRGFDGEWVKADMLVIPAGSFSAQDLSKPLPRETKADLAVSLEVAEHLDASAAPVLIDSLTRAAPVVLFSAAIPLQGGSHHVNEQWPQYWEKLFAERGYVAVDCIRRRIWLDEEVSFFYKQNILIFVSKEKLSSYPKLEREYVAGNDRALPLVHPHMYLYYAKRWRSVVPFLGKLPPWLLHSIKRLISRRG